MSWGSLIFFIYSITGWKIIIQNGGQRPDVQGASMSKIQLAIVHTFVRLGHGRTILWTTSLLIIK